MIRLTNQAFLRPRDLPRAPGTIRFYNERHAEQAMTTYIHELYAHQEWADAEHWRAFEAHPAALADKAICERLLHIHQVQHAFLWITGPRTAEFAFKKLEDFPRMADMKEYARRYHAAAGESLNGLDQVKLEEPVEAWE